MQKWPVFHLISKRSLKIYFFCIFFINYQWVWECSFETRWTWIRTYLHEKGRMIRAIITRKHIKSKTRATIPQVLQYFNSVGGKQFWIVKNCKTCGCHHPWYYSFKIMAVCETSWLFTNYAWPKICRKFEYESNAMIVR